MAGFDVAFIDDADLIVLSEICAFNKTVVKNEETFQPPHFVISINLDYM